MNFKDFYWHDSVIKNIIINRDNPGIKDEIKIEIVWDDNDERVNVVFEGVYWVRMDLNFGIIASENILRGYLFPSNDKDLINLYSSRKGFLDDIKLNVYEIELNSTGGRIKIIAKSFRVEKL
ncbi:MAG: hypothetical protein LBL58_19240 [Tannerellaceae bacterium]|nr:hypothetical protein [Tannerellaceae bacterium]